MVQGIPPRKPQVNSQQASFGQNSQRAGNDQQQQNRDKQIQKILEELLGKQSNNPGPQRTAQAAPPSGGGGDGQAQPVDGGNSGGEGQKLTLADLLKLAEAMFDQQKNDKGGNENQFARNNNNQGGGAGNGGAQQPGFGRLNAMA